MYKYVGLACHFHIEYKNIHIHIVRTLYILIHLNLTINGLLWEGNRQNYTFGESDSTGFQYLKVSHN